MTLSVDIRARLVETFRRDLIGPHPGPEDADLATERLSENPSRWYLAGFLAPADDEMSMNAPGEDDNPGAQEERENQSDLVEDAGAGGAAGDQDQPDPPNSRRRFLPSSIGLTVLLPSAITEIEAKVTWGDYLTEPPLPETILIAEDEIGEDGKPKRRSLPDVEWVRAPRERTVPLRVPQGGRGEPVTVPESASAQRKGGGLQLETHARLFEYRTPEGATEQVRALTVFLVNRRATSRRRYADVTFAFQVRLELSCPTGFHPRTDLSGVDASDGDHRVADLHYRDVEEYAVGRNSAAGWPPARDSKVTRVWTDPLPSAEVERVAPNEDPVLTSHVEFGMEQLAYLAKARDATLSDKLKQLPKLYDAWIERERGKLPHLVTRRRDTAQSLIDNMEVASRRVSAGIELVAKNDIARTAFRLMNEAVSRASRRRGAGAGGDPASQPSPKWRPFQLAFILLNLSGLADPPHPDRELADLLFFPTGGGKTEAYLGLAAFVIAHRRLTGPGVLGAGVAVIMRYTLRLLTLDQLARAAGVVCALELMRDDPANIDAKGRKILGDWPIEIGLWVGSDASPNRLGRTGDGDKHTAVGRVQRYKNGQDKRAPAPLKACPWCGTPFARTSFACVPNNTAPTNMEIRCVNTDCDFTRDRALPVLTVDEPIYRRLPAFLIATVDKFAGLPWLGEPGAFFGNVDRFLPNVGFFGACDPGHGRPLDGGWRLDPPALIIQDELHLISGPLGTVAGLYEAAIDQLSSRQVGDRCIRPKIVASTATVRRAQAQIEALFDRAETRVFPPPGIDRTDSFFAQTIPSSKDPARVYIGISAQGRGPKLVFLRALTTLVAAAQAQFDRAGGTPNPADPYMTAVCYFNALRELGGARRIVEDEVRDRAGRYGTQRRRLMPRDMPFADRQLKEPIELTSRVSTDEVAKAKQRLEAVFGKSSETVDVALATNMISVGLDITRLGLMLVQGQPKTAAEYIQATSRVGRDHNRPGLVVAVLNMHKPRDRMHFEQFGYFHRTFYRAVEATSVTPWAARALDRALAAILVAAARHIDPSLTPEGAVVRLKDHPETRARVRDAILHRAPAHLIAGGTAALAAQIDHLFDAWMATATAQTAGGSQFRYYEAKSPARLLHQPLEAGLGNLSSDHRLFVAGRSMRDVESSVHLLVKDPYGRPIQNADDLV
jgi:hypothetical protein